MTHPRSRVAYIGLGSNLGDRRGNIEAALERLERLPGVRVRRRSSLRETEPAGVADQPLFLNGVAEVETDLTPSRLMERLLEIEKEGGRIRRRRWGPREVDLDLLLYGDRVIKTDRLIVPHPRLPERRFVLEPLAELNPRLVVPGTGRTVRRLLSLLEQGAPA